MGDIGGMKQSHRTTVSQDASSARTQRGGGHNSDSEDKAAEWQKVMGRLTELGDDLTKPEDKAPRAEIYKGIQDALHALCACGPPAPGTRNQDNLEGKLKKLEEKIDAIATRITAQKGQTWASVAAAAP